MNSINEDRVIVTHSPKPIKEPSERLPWPRKAEDGTPLGVDVVAKQKDIIKLVYKFFNVKGVPMEELLQEVYLAIIHKNYTRSAHDPRKSSFGHYIFMLGNNCSINLVHKKRRYDREKEFLDAYEGDERKSALDTIEDQGFLNMNEDSIINPESKDIAEEYEMLLRKKNMHELARYVRAVRNGAKPDIIREALSFGNKKYSNKSIRDFREQLKEFVEQTNL